MQVFTLCLLLLAAGFMLAPGIMVSRRSGIFAKTAAIRSSIRSGANREYRPIRSAGHSPQISVKTGSRPATAHAPVVYHASSNFTAKNRGRPEASQ